MDTYEIEMQIVPSEDDTLFLPVGRGISGINITSHRNSLEKGEVEKIVELTDENCVVDERNNQYIEYDIYAGERLRIQRRTNSLPPSPELDPKLCLNNGEWYCKWQQGGYLEKVALNRQRISDMEKVKLFGERIKKLKYSFPRTKYEWADEVLKKNLPQDCLGMHGVLCAMLRCAGIPAIVDVGLRLDAQDSPHVWLWYFDFEKNNWFIVDLNDSQKKVLIGCEVKNPRISISLGTTHHIDGGIASFVQYFASKKVLEKTLKNRHDVRVMVRNV